jgi:hypothetical protein
MLKHTRGIIFLGTPFRGTGTGDAAELRVRLIRAMGGESSSSLIEYVQDPENKLHETVKRFTRVARDREVPLACFYETKPSFVLNGLLPNRLLSLIPERLKIWIPFAKERIVRLHLYHTMCLSQLTSELPSWYQGTLLSFSIMPHMPCLSSMDL